MRKWLLYGGIALIAAMLGFTVRYWLHPLLAFVSTNTDTIQGVTDLVQLLLWIGAAILAIVGYRHHSDAVSKPSFSGALTTGGGAVVAETVDTGGGDFIGRDVNLIIAQSAQDFLRGLRSDLSPETLQRATETYLLCLLDRHRYLNLKGMGVSDRIPLKLPLLDLYIPLKARLEMPEGETWKRRFSQAELRLAGREDQGLLTGQLGEPQPVLELLQKHPGLIILGDPGAGKTTFLKFLALRLAIGEGADLALDHRLPVLVPLSAYANALAEADVRLDDFIAGYFHDIGADLPVRDMLAQALQQGKALVLLDGLDEIKELGLRHTVVERVVDFFTFHRRMGNKFVLTSRIVGYRDVRPTTEGLVECTLIDFDDEEIENFVACWTTALERQAVGEGAVARVEAERECQELLTAIVQNVGVRQLAANPLLLTILALMKRQGVVLPEGRVELYDSYVRTMLSSWNRARGLGRPPTHDLDVVQTLRMLAPLALWMHTVSPGVGLVKREDLRRRLETIYRERGEKSPEEAAQQFLSDVREYAGLLLERGPGEYGFIHLTFEEYLAAMAIALQGQGDCRPIVDALQEHLGDPAWREVALLTVAYVGVVQQLDSVAGDVVEALAAMPHDSPGTAVVLAGEAVLDAGKSGVRPGSRERVKAALKATMQSLTVAAPLRRRAGWLLGNLGYRPDDLDAFVEIPAGRFLFGDAKEPRELPYRYWIGAYPVTNAQFARFVDDGGYDRKTLWSANGWAWRTGTYDSKAPKQYRDWLSRRPPEKRNVPYYWQDTKWNNPLFPVVGVTWFEAAAYCAWLKVQSRKFEVYKEGQVKPLDLGHSTFDIRLPSEEEWERAARGPALSQGEGTDGREYPWGNALDFTRLNCADFWAGRELDDKAWQDFWGSLSESAGTTAVCTYPEGRTVAGVWDMSGNVWEWTRSPLDEIYLVLRGGSWVQQLRYARGGFRFRDFPDSFDGSYGFRVVLSLGDSGF